MPQESPSRTTIAALCLAAAAIPTAVATASSGVVSTIAWVVAVLLLLSGIGLAWSAYRGKPASAPVISLRMYGESQMKLRLREGHDQVALIEVGIENSNPFNLTGVAINALFPETLEVAYVDQDGVTKSGGAWLETDERLPGEPAPFPHKRYWSEGGISLPGSGSFVAYFRVRVTEPGDYYLAAELFGSVEKSREYEILSVATAEIDDEDAVVQLGEVIAKGEAVLTSTPSVYDDGVKGDFAEWIIACSYMEAVLPPHLRAWYENVIEEIRDEPGTGDPWYRTQIRARLPYLHRLRRRVAARESG